MNRIYHKWDKWECYRAGFHNTSINMTDEEAYNYYIDILGNMDKFENAIVRVFSEWKYSCEHFLSNPSLNKVAWLGQASVCIESGVPASYRSGFYLLSKDKQEDANKLAKEYVDFWETNNGKF